MFRFITQNQEKKKMTNKTRRILLNGIWTTPIISAISLPAHAQTSVCLMADLVGRWRSASDGSYLIDLFADGSTSFSASFWSVNSSEFRLTSDISDVVFVAPVTSNCDELVGIQTVNIVSPPEVTNVTLQRVS